MNQHFYRIVLGVSMSFTALAIGPDYSIGSGEGEAKSCSGTPSHEPSIRRDYFMYLLPIEPMLNGGPEGADYIYDFEKVSPGDFVSPVHHEISHECENGDWSRPMSSYTVERRAETEEDLILGSVTYPIGSKLSRSSGNHYNYNQEVPVGARKDTLKVVSSNRIANSRNADQSKPESTYVITVSENTNLPLSGPAVVTTTNNQNQNLYEPLKFQRNKVVPRRVYSKTKKYLKRTAGSDRFVSIREDNTYFSGAKYPKVPEDAHRKRKMVLEERDNNGTSIYLLRYEVHDGRLHGYLRPFFSDIVAIHFAEATTSEKGDIYSLFYNYRCQLVGWRLNEDRIEYSSDPQTIFGSISLGSGSNRATLVWERVKDKLKHDFRSPFEICNSAVQAETWGF